MKTLSTDTVHNHFIIPNNHHLVYGIYLVNIQYYYSGSKNMSTEFMVEPKRYTKMKSVRTQIENYIQIKQKISEHVRLKDLSAVNVSIPLFKSITKALSEAAI